MYSFLIITDSINLLTISSDTNEPALTIDAISTPTLDLFLILPIFSNLPSTGLIFGMILNIFFISISLYTDAIIAINKFFN